MGTTPSKSCGKGSTRSPRSRSSLARRSASAALASAIAARRLADVDLRDLELARGAARHGHGDDLVALAAEQRLAHGRLVREAPVRGIGLGRADDLVLRRLVGLLVLDVHDR